MVSITGYFKKVVAKVRFLSHPGNSYPKFYNRGTAGDGQRSAHTGEGSNFQMKRRSGCRGKSFIAKAGGDGRRRTAIRTRTGYQKQPISSSDSMWSVSARRK